jgi:hypothetical protein
MVAQLQRTAPGAPINIFEEGAKMSTVNIGTSYGQVNIDSNFQGPVSVVQSLAPGELKSSLEALLAATNGLAARLPPDSREQVAKQTADIVGQASAKDPDRSQLTVSAKGLVEAAKAVAEFAGPVTIAVKAVLGLFGIPL